MMSLKIDFDLLNNENITVQRFENFNNQRIVNSFLFNCIKIQDKIGAKLFKNFLNVLIELDDFSTPMIDVMHILEKLQILDSTEDWDKLREIRNSITLGYPTVMEE